MSPKHTPGTGASGSPPPSGFPMRRDIAPWRQEISRRFVTTLNRASDWLLDHWLSIINVGVGALLGIAILTPVLAYFGVEPLASTIFRSTHAICDQIPSHSFFICGHQVGICSRCCALYGSIWLSSMMFRFGRQRIEPIRWYMLLPFLLPMALDGGTQLFGWRESNVYLRLITGALFGLGMMWFALPYVQKAVDESKAMIVPRPAQQAGG